MTLPASENKFLSFSDLTIGEPSQAYRLLQANWDENRLDCLESFAMLLIDERCRVVGWADLPLDMSAVSQADACKVIALAAKENAQGFVLAHNKPYGVILPERSDLNFIALLSDAARKEEMLMLDYLFINRNGYYSYMDDEYHLAASLYPFW